MNAKSKKSAAVRPETFDPTDDDILPVELQLALLRALSRGTGCGFTEAEAEKIFAWAIDTRANQALMELAAAELIKISFNPQGELVFGAIRPGPAELGDAGAGGDLVLDA